MKLDSLKFDEEDFLNFMEGMFTVLFWAFIIGVSISLFVLSLSLSAFLHNPLPLISFIILFIGTVVGIRRVQIKREERTKEKYSNFLRR